MNKENLRSSKVILIGGIALGLVALLLIGQSVFSGATVFAEETEVASEVVSEATEEVGFTEIASSEEEPISEEPVESLGCLSRLETNEDGSITFYVNYEHRDLVSIPEELAQYVVYE